MSAVTTIRKIFMLANGDKYDPIRESALQAQSIEDAMAALPVSVGSVSERTAVWGTTPKQGSAVYRTDLGTFERYFEAYNQTTNPGGSVAGAGWYPESGRVPFFEVFGRPGGQNAAAGWNQLNAIWESPTINRGYTSFTGGVLRIATSGIYQVSCSFATAAGVASGNRGIQLTKNTTGIDTTGTLNKLEVQGLGSTASFPVQLNAGDEIRFFVNVGGAQGLGAYRGDTVWRVSYLSLY